MKYSKLGFSGLSVSRVCLGTMTWGTQNNQQDANEQIEYALDQGINFFDTAGDVRCAADGGNLWCDGNDYW